MARDLRLVGAEFATVLAPFLPEQPPIRRVAAHPMSALRAVSGVVRCSYAEPADGAPWPCGISLEACAAGSLFRAAAEGEIEDPSWAWEPGRAILLGALGTLTQFVTNQAMIQVLGQAMSPTRMLVRFGTPVLLQR